MGFFDVLKAEGQYQDELQRTQQLHHEDDLVKQYGIGALKARDAGIPDDMLKDAAFNDQQIAMWDTKGVLRVVPFEDASAAADAGYKLAKKDDYQKVVEQNNQRSQQKELEGGSAQLFTAAHGIGSAIAPGAYDALVKRAVGAEPAPREADREINQPANPIVPQGLAQATGETKRDVIARSGDPEAIQNMVTQDAAFLQQQAAQGQKEHEYNQFVAGSAAANPITSIGGTIAGSLAPYGALGAIGKAGTAVKAGLGGGLIGSAAKVATEGALFGASSAAEKSALRDSPTSVATFFEEAGKDSILPMILGAGFEGAGGLLRKVAKTGVLGEAIANRVLLGEEAAKVPEADRAFDAAKKQLLREQEAKVIGGPGPAIANEAEQGYLRGAKGYLDQAQEAASTELPQYDVVAKTKLGVQQVNLRQEFQDLLNGDLRANVPGKQRQAFLNAEGALQDTPPLSPKNFEHAEKLVELASEDPRFSPEQVQKLKQTLLDWKQANHDLLNMPSKQAADLADAQKAYEGIYSGVEQDASQRAEAAYAGEAQRLVGLKGIPDKVPTPQAAVPDEIANMTSKQLQAAKAAEISSIKAQQSASREALAPDLQAFREKILPVLKDVPGQLAKSDATGQGLGRELMKAERKFEDIADWVGTNPQRGIEALTSLANKVERLGEYLPESKGAFADIAEQARLFKRQIESTTAEPMSDRLASITDRIQNSAPMASKGLLAGGAGALAGHALAGAAGLHGYVAYAMAAGAATLARSLTKADSAFGMRLKNAINFIGQKAPGAISAAGGAAQSIAKAELFQPKHEDMTKVAQTLQAQASNPAALSAQVDQKLNGLKMIDEDYFNKVKDAIIQTAQYLATQAPKPPSTTAQTQFDSYKWQMNDSQAASFKRRVRAAVAPSVIVDEVRSGSLSPETLETVEALHPEVLDMVRTLTQQRLMDVKHVPYSQRVSLSRLMGKPLDSTLEPSYIYGQQQSWQQAAQQQKPQSKGGYTIKTKSKDEQTQSQRVTDM